MGNVVSIQLTYIYDAFTNTSMVSLSSRPAGSQGGTV